LELEAQPAAVVDRLINQLRPHSEPEAGWTRVVFGAASPSTSEDVRARLNAALENLAGLAFGLWTVATSAQFDTKFTLFDGKTDVSWFPAYEQSAVTQAEEAPDHPIDREQPVEPRREGTEEERTELSPRAASVISTDLPRELRSPNDTQTEDPKQERDWRTPREGRAIRVAAADSTSRQSMPPRAEYAPTFPGQARLRKPVGAAPQQPSRRLTSEVPKVSAASTPFTWPGETARVAGSDRTVAADDFLPPVRVRVQWPELPKREPVTEYVSAEAQQAAAAEDTIAPSPLYCQNPFALSELEEQMADVLERAARETGVDLR
jgi:hypothetical protein